MAERIRKPTKRKRLTMPYYSSKSKAILATCDPRLQDIFNTLIEWFDLSIISGHRGEAEQNKIHDEGFSQVRYPDSKHNADPARAVDVAPYPIDWEDRERFTYLAGWVMAIAKMKGYHIRWGGDWAESTDLKQNGFDDLGHFELMEP